MTTPVPGAPSFAGRYVHHGQVSRGFTRTAGAYPARLLAADTSSALVQRVSDRQLVTFAVARPDDLAATLERDDLTLLDGHPLVLVSPGYGVLGIATGPAAPPDRLSVVFVSRLEGGHAVEIPASGAEQPSWQLFAVTGGSD